MEYKPFYYQQYAENFVIQNKQAGLFLDMGMGKTAITLSALHELKFDYFDINKTLVIAPLQPAKDTWPKEIEKWNHTKEFTYSLILGPEKNRLQALHKEVDIYIINRENVPWLVKYYKNKWPFDMVVIDELSSFKSNSAVRFKALRKVRKHIHRIIGLTGTPTPNGLIDLWPQVYLLDEGERLGKTITGYRNKYFLPDKRNATTIFSWKLKEGSEQEIYSQLDDLCVSMKSADYLKLPERRSIQHLVELPVKAMDTYNQLEKDLFLPFKDGDIDAGSAAVLTNKLLQVAGGRVYGENRNIEKIHSAKLEKLEQLIDEANGQPVLIFYNYQHECDQIMEKYPEARRIKEDEAVIDWNNGDC
ncbi:MAG: DEAD/DEAH box helicase family protein, partial [Clostridiales bacterium]|nr:DEAD/DEAH box helicase family protein [Clostridiales bacterium]